MGLYSGVMVGMLLFLPCVCWAQGHPDGPRKVLVVERDVRMSILDPLNRVRNVHREERVWIAPERVRIEDLTHSKDLLIELDRKGLVLLDRAAGTYAVIGFDEIASRRKAFLEELGGLRKRVRGTAEEADLARIQRGLERGAGEVRVAPTGRVARVLGSECREIQMLMGGRLEVLRIFPHPDYPEGRTFLRALASMHGLPQSALPDLAKIEGFPVQGVIRYILVLDRVESRSRVTAMERRVPPEGIFAVPEDFREVPFPGMESPRKLEVPKPSGN